MRTAVPCLLAAVLLAACGGGGGSAPTYELTFGSVAGLDGIVEADGTVYEDDAYGISCGQIDLNVGVRGFVVFDITGLPVDATIVAATLTLRQFQISGSPYAKLGGAIVLDRIDIGAVLDAGDYSSVAYESGFGTLSTSEALGTRSLEVGPQVQADRTAGHDLSSYRLRFVIEADGTVSADYANFNSQENPDGSGVTPTLTVYYTLP